LKTAFLVTSSDKFPYFLMKFKKTANAFYSLIKNPPEGTKIPIVLPNGGLIAVHTPGYKPRVALTNFHWGMG
jgi:hypothetical protein